MNNKAQTSIEFVIVVSIITTISVLFFLTVYNTFDETTITFMTKQRTNQLLSVNGSTDYLYTISQNIEDNNISIFIGIKQVNESNYEIHEDDYLTLKSNLEDNTKYENITFNVYYT